MPSPKSKSPKSKSSSVKKSPPNGGDLERKDSAIQTTPNLLCYFCQKSFKDPASIQAHIVLMNHMPPNSPELQQCHGCKSIIMLKDVEKHNCPVMKTFYLRFMSCSITLAYGPPYKCLYCRGQPLGSRIELALHLLCLHKPDRSAGQCGMCEFTFDELPERQTQQLSNLPQLSPEATKEEKEQYNKEVKRLKEEFICEPTDSPNPGLENLLKHVRIEHVPGYMLLNRRNIFDDTNLRYPYTCPMCNWRLKSNCELHAHIICCHGNKRVIDGHLKICAICKFSAFDDTSLNDHILMNHLESFKKLGDLWVKHELLMNVTDPGHVCIYCWETFRFDFQLQTHMLVAHATSNVLRCGWCKIDFLSCPDPILAMMLMQNHEFNHSRTLHELALKLNLITEPVAEPLPEIADKQLLIDNRKGINNGQDNAALLAGNKRKSKSPKSKSSPKSSSKKK